MNVLIRVDASLQIGTGHVMRCLALADGLRAGGATVAFICREHQGSLVDLVRNRGFPVHSLARVESLPDSAGPTASLPTHAGWLGTSMQEDARESARIVEGVTPDWLVVDHYALDDRWERELRGACRRLMAIDDLADRRHDCDLLLDQNLGRVATDYDGLVPAGCATLVGTLYALLRREFAEKRAESLARRAQPRLERILVTMGGVDQDNATAGVLRALAQSRLPRDVTVRVVMGPRAPWLGDVRQLANAMPWPCRVDVGVTDMARLMCESDLAIGAAGSTSWERCCLGVPSMIVVLADNQRAAAVALVDQGAAVVVDLDNLGEAVPAFFRGGSLLDTMRGLSASSASLVDGRGVDRVVDSMRKMT